MFTQQQFCRVNYVRIPKNEHGQSRGFALIFFRRHEEAAVAMEELEGSKFDGLVLHPRWAAPQRKKIEEQKRPKEEQKRKRKRNGSRRKHPVEVVKAMTPILFYHGEARVKRKS